MGFDIVHVSNKDLKVKKEYMVYDSIVECVPELAHLEIWRTKEGFGNARTLFLKDEKIYFGDNLGNIVVLNSKDGSVLSKYALHEGIVSQVKFFSNGNRIVSAGFDDNTVKVTDANTGQVSWTYSGHTDSVTSVYVTNDGVVYSGSLDSTVKRLSNGAEVWSYQANSAVYDVLFVAGFVYILTGDGSISKITNDGNLVWTMNLSGGVARSFIFDPITYHFYIAMFNGVVHVVTTDNVLIDTIHTSSEKQVFGVAKTKNAVFTTGSSGNLEKFINSKHAYTHVIGQGAGRGLTVDNFDGIFIAIDNVGVIKLTQSLQMTGYTDVIS